MRALLAPLLAAALCACSSLETSFDYDTAADFSRLSTYTWIETTPGAEASSLTLQRVRAAVDEALAARGYRADSQAPDFLVAAHISTEERTQVTDWGYTYAPRGAWYGARDIDVYTYQEGTLILDVVDAASRSLMWRGTASRMVDPSWTPEEREEIVREAVAELLERFPPQQKP
jgi:hypothetical protein